MTYLEFKDFIGQHKREAVFGVSFILVFLLGFGTGRYTGKNSNAVNPARYVNYNTAATAQPAAQVQGATTAAPPAIAPVASPTAAADTATQNCVIKGNISSTGKKIFHIPGGAYYKITKPEQCFNTEAEAVAAGFIKSSR